MAILTDFINAAMSHAEYEDLGDERWYGRIPGFDGLWASAPGLDEIRMELRSSLEDWILVGVRLGDTLPVVEENDLKDLTADSS